MFSTWLLHLTSRQRKDSRRASWLRNQLRRFSPRLEVLEDRLTPSTLTVMNPSDHDPGSLRADILLAAAGDTIVFDPSLTGQTITLTSGELAISKNLTITGLGATNTTINGNHNSRIFDITAGAVTLDSLTLTNGFFSGFGGAIISYSTGLLTIQNSTLSGNSAGSEGGAIYNGGSGGVTVTNSTLSGNSGGGQGGAILGEHGNVTVSNSTISGNSAAFQGGGIFTFFGNLAVSNSTISGNTTGFQGGGIWAFSGTVMIRSSIVAKNNGSPADLSPGSGTLTISNSLIGDNTGTGKTPAPVGSPDANGNLIGTHAVVINPQLGPLQENGGPTKTMALLPGSPAIDHGANPDGLTTDQRGQGFVRTFPALGSTDMGAYEAEFIAPTIISLSQASAPEGGPTFTLTINGTNFSSSSQVLWNNTSLTITSQSSTQLQASVPNTLITEEGTASITVVNPGLTGGTSNAQTFTVTDAPLTATGVTISPTAGAPFSGVVASFTDANAAAPVGDFSATMITWGDGHTSTGVIAGDGLGHFTVSGTNTYAMAGPNTVSVQIIDVGGSTVTVSSMISVANLGQGVQVGLTGGISFWHNRNGQALIKSFNGGSSSTALATWLAATFPNLYGAGAGINLTGQSNDTVAAFYLSQFALHGTKLEAEVLATALSVYATTSSLGGTAGAAYGFTVSATGLGARSFNVRDDGAAFGVPNQTTLNVYQLLLAVDQQAISGVLNNGNTALRDHAHDVFADLLDTGAIDG